jgi:drug/metabolite transporter (DMT)-like permease
MAVSWQQQVCIAAILIGVLVGMAPGSLPQYSPRRLLLGGVLALLSAVGQGVGQVLSRKAYQVVRAGGISVDSATVTFERVLAGLLAAGVALAVVRLWASRRNQVQDTAVAPQASAAAWPWVLLNSLTGPVLGVTCLQWALSQPSMSAGITQSIVATAPLLTAPLAWRLGGELLPRLRYFAGAVLAVAGTASLALQWWK